MTRQSSALALIVSAAALMLGTVAFCATTDPQDAPKGAALAVIAGGMILPAACIIGAAGDAQA
jgi:hypothetical protein